MEATASLPPRLPAANSPWLPASELPRPGTFIHHSSPATSLSVTRNPKAQWGSLCLPLSSSITPLHPPFLYKCREQISESLRRRYTTSLTSVVSLQTKRPRRLSLSHTLSSKQRREKQRKGKLSPSPFIAYFTCLAEHRLSRGHSFA